MSFKIVKPEQGKDDSRAVLDGIANGFGELYPVLDHPSGVSKLLRGKDVLKVSRKAEPKVRKKQA